MGTLAPHELEKQNKKLIEEQKEKYEGTIEILNDNIINLWRKQKIHHYQKQTNRTAQKEIKRLEHLLQEQNETSSLG